MQESERAKHLQGTSLNISLFRVCKTQGSVANLEDFCVWNGVMLGASGAADTSPFIFAFADLDI